MSEANLLWCAGENCPRFSSATVDGGFSPNEAAMICVGWQVTQYMGVVELGSGDTSAAGEMPCETALRAIGPETAASILAAVQQENE